MAWKFVLIFGLAVVGLYFTLPNALSQDIVYSSLGTASVVCILVGVRWQRPSERLGWYLLAVAGSCFTLGDDVWSFYNIALHISVPFPSGADALYLSGYPFLFAGILRLTRNPNRTIRREDNADATVVALGALAISWHFLMSSYVHDTTLSKFGMVVNLAYPMMDIALVFILFRALVFRESKLAFQRILAAAVTVMFLGDFTYDLLVLHNSYQTGNICDALFLVEYVLIGTAALHPSVSATSGTRSEARVADRQEPGNRRRLPAVLVAGFIPPMILVVTTLLGVSVNVLVMAVLCLAVFAVICLRMLWLINRITRQAEAMNASDASLRHMAFHDELTGLANRALFYDRVDHALAGMTRSGRSMALCFGDLDGFKMVNDTLGHHVGDAVLVKVGSILESVVRPGDTVARLGGDEFAVLLVGLDRPDMAEDLAGRIVNAVQVGSESDGDLAGISISVGLAFADSTTPIDQLISEADAAMYEAKANGKNRVEIFQSNMRGRLVDRLVLTSGFRGSLERGEYLLEFQPIYRLDDRVIQGFEALVRWQHPSLGLVPPQSFIPIAEDTGFIVPLGRWVLIEACEQVAAWSRQAKVRVGLAVNVSRRQLVAPDFVEDVRSALALSGIDPKTVVLEVTEGVLMEKPEQADLALSQLRALGVSIAVDDFGTGYSSLSHLQRFPVDVLKIDKSFVDPLNTSEPDSSALVASIVGLASSLNLQVVAEGIEREDQIDRLLDLGCHYGQGFLMGRPLDARRAESLLRGYRRSAPAL